MKKGPNEKIDNEHFDTIMIPLVVGGGAASIGIMWLINGNWMWAIPVLSAGILGLKTGIERIIDPYKDEQV